MESEGRKVKLRFVNAEEMVPRQVSAYGALTKGVMAALVLRPTEGRGVLVRLEKGGAQIWEAAEGRDSPERPSRPIAEEEAGALLKEAQRNLPEATKLTLHEEWRGHLLCDNGLPRVVLERKAASYATLRIASSGAKGWQWEVLREARWYASSGRDAGQSGTLREAIVEGIRRLLGLVGEACSVRDSHRRAALDAEYGAKHPLKPSKEQKNPLDKMMPPKREKASKKLQPASPEPAGKPAAEETKTRAPRKRSSAPAPAPAPVSAAPAASPAPPPAPPPASAPAAGSLEVDPAKDALLMDAFAKGMDAVMSKYLGAQSGASSTATEKLQAPAGSRTAKAQSTQKARK